MRKRLLLCAVALYSAACATGTTTPRASDAASKAAGEQFASMLRSRSEHTDSKEFREDLEAVYEQILNRGALADPKINRIEAPHVEVVDIEAAASIPIPEHRTIQSAVRLFSGDLKPKIQDSLARSSRYRPLIDRALAAYDLPKGLAYLPIIESAFLPTLTSRAGAHGIWQFMPDTAREYGLRVDWWIDERADPERSTMAAAKYLRYLYDRFGDWSLALAAYNCGPNRVRRVLDEAGATTFWELLEAGLLPKETRGYVPTFYATLLIASDPEAYGFRLADPVETNHQAVDVEGPVSLAWIAEVAGVPEGELKTLNPALRRGVVPPGRGRVLVPSHAARPLLSRAASLAREDEHLRYSTYTLRQGDTLARVARSIGSTTDTLIAMNGLRSSADVRAGETIYVPVKAREVGSLIAHGRNREIYYSVRKGDTLFSIARRNGISVADLRELNDLTAKSVLRIGQKLRVSVPSTATAGGM